MAAVLYPLLGVALGLYYNLTFFGAAALPMPEPVSLLGPMLYYLAGSVHLPPREQAIAWVASVALAGILWLAALFFMATREGRRVPWRTVLSPALLLLPAPWLVYLHGTGPRGFSWDACFTACLIRKFGLTPLELEQAVTGLGPLMLALGAVAGGLGLYGWWTAGLRRPFVAYGLSLLMSLVAVLLVAWLLASFVGPI